MAGHRAFMIALLVVVSGLLFPRCCAAARPSPSSSNPDDLTRSQNLVPFFVGVGVFSAVVFCVMLILSIILCLIRSYQRNRRRLYSVSGEEEGIFDDIGWERPGISAKELERIPERLYYAEVKELLVGKRAVECAVCLCDFEDHERLRLLPGCSHAFHRDCIDTWLSSHLTCPSCRADIVSALATSGKEEGGVAAGDSYSSRESSEPGHEVAVVVDPAVVTAGQEEKEDRKRKEVHELLDLGRRVRQSCPRVVGGGQWPPELPCPPSRSVGYCTERKLEDEFFVIGLDEF